MMDTITSGSSGSAAVGAQLRPLGAVWLQLCCRAARLRVLQLQHAVDCSLGVIATDNAECAVGSSSLHVCDIYNAAGGLAAALQALCKALPDTSLLLDVSANKRQPGQQPPPAEAHHSSSIRFPTASVAPTQEACSKMLQLQSELLQCQEMLEAWCKAVHHICTASCGSTSGTDSCSSSSASITSSTCSTVQQQAKPNNSKVLAEQQDPDMLLNRLRSYEPLHTLPQTCSQLLQAVDGLCALLLVSCCCNYPGCSNRSGCSELQLVGGKSCVCAGCKTARYCFRSCQQQHWHMHKPACKQIRAAAAAATEAADVKVAAAGTAAEATGSSCQSWHVSQ